MTLWVSLAVGALFAGGLLLAMGELKLGRFIRFIPYPVVGGFLAGTGWLLTVGSFKVMTGFELRWENLGTFRQPDLAALWMVGPLFAVILMGTLKRFKHHLVFPAVLLGVVLLSYIGLLAAGTSLDSARTKGWLFQMFGNTSVLEPWYLFKIETVDWFLVASQSGSIAATAVVIAITILLAATGLELATGRDADLDHELRIHGWANLGAGICGGMPGCLSVNRSLLNLEAGASGRWAGLLASLTCGAVLVFHVPVLAWPTVGTIWTRAGSCTAEVTDTKARVYFESMFVSARAHDQSTVVSFTATNVNFSGFAYGQWDWMGAPGESPVVAVVTKLDGETGTTPLQDQFCQFDGSARTDTGAARAVSWVEFEGNFYAEQDVYGDELVEDDGYYVRAGAQATATSTDSSASKIYVEEDSAYWMLENEAHTGDPTHTVDLNDEEAGFGFYDNGVFRFAVASDAGDTDYTQEGASMLTFIAELNMTVYVEAYVAQPGGSEADAYMKGSVKELESYVELVQE